MPTRRPIDDPTALDMLEAITRVVLMAIGGIQIGIVKAYDPVKRTADVQPVRRRRVWRKPADLPLVAQAPVGWWRFGQMVLAGELEAGDEVLLVSCAREVWPWYLAGDTVDPQSERMHDPTDTIVLPWISSIKRAITARAPRTFFVGREDGTAGISIPMDVPARLVVDAGPLGIVLGSGAVEPALKGTTASAAINGYASSITAANTALNTAAQTFWNLPSQPLPTAPEIAAYTTAWAAWNTATGAAQAALSAGLTASLAAKVVVE